MSATILSFMKKEPEEVLTEIAMKNAKLKKDNLWGYFHSSNEDTAIGISETIKKIEKVISLLMRTTIISLGIIILSLATLGSGLFLGKEIALISLGVAALGIAGGSTSYKLSNTVQDKLNNFYKKYKLLHVNGWNAVKGWALHNFQGLTSLEYRIINNLY